jgi:alanine-glyoxylate transaminase / serine-glyoxylate transaminase / serine-pyruvate transaminase
MTYSERLLMGPGPSNLYPEVVSALCRPLLGHLDPEFLGVLEETCERLRSAFVTSNSLTIPISGTGSAGMETAFVNFVRPGDSVVVGVNGLFGERMCEVAARLGAEVVRVEARWGEPLDPVAVVEAHPSPSIIAVVHAETSTGVRNDVEEMGRAKGDALLVVDCVTSLGGIEVAVDGWGADVVYSGTQKCLGVSPGLAPFTANERARSRLRERPPSWYLDLGLISRYVEAGSGRAYHHTAPVSLVFALHAALGLLLEEGLEAAWSRHETFGTQLQEGLEAMGLSLVAPKGHRLPQLSTVWVPDELPDQMDEARFRTALLERYGIEIGGGAGPLSGKIWRIGCMGHNARRQNVTLLLAAMGELLGR